MSNREPLQIGSGISTRSARQIDWISDWVTKFAGGGVTFIFAHAKSGLNPLNVALALKGQQDAPYYIANIHARLGLRVYRINDWVNGKNPFTENDIAVEFIMEMARFDSSIEVMNLRYPFARIDYEDGALMPPGFGIRIILAAYQAVRTHPAMGVAA